ncbi:TIR domain-containing protein [Fundicoccus culcitae]|uniref:TIR domain-containing protein n=1 Tax=Fundicoccus culcitae TaxID=2969821 RepID=A0ABY5P975_9LACT|nr:TIR domain-containing protein [Fundicoccus culcitae]UUX35224.1 TIR domain-containing protein [Fundicoccus culcitae]
MHKTFISYHHKNEQDLKDEIIRKGLEGGEFIDKSVSDGDIDTNLEEDRIMRIIREEFLQDSSVVMVLIGEETSQRPFINSEIQAGLWGSNPTGLIGVVRDEVYERIYTETTCTYSGCNCGSSLNVPTNEFVNKIPNLIYRNYFLLEDNKDTAPHFKNSDAYASEYSGAN